MNLYTAWLNDMKAKVSLPTHYKGIVEKLDAMLSSIDELREDPLFIDKIHGEQELSLDQTIELFNGIRSHFVPADAQKDLEPGFETNSFDVS